MDNMILFSEVFLGLVAEFLQAPPVFYLFGLICFCFICKAVKILIS